MLSIGDAEGESNNIDKSMNNQEGDYIVPTTDKAFLEQLENIVEWVMGYEKSPTDVKLFGMLEGEESIAYFRPPNKIAYKEGLFKKYSTAPQYRWVITAILAHEIHHVKEYNHKKYKDSQLESDYEEKAELEADRYAGRMLGLMGASEEEAVRFIHILYNEVASEGKTPYLSKTRRLAAVRDGYALGINSNCMSNKGHCHERFVTKNFQGTDMNLVFVGEFVIGSRDDDYDESPTLRVEFKEPFWIDQTEVTRKAYNKCVDDNEACKPAPENNVSKGDMYPINMVTWHQATDYCKWRGAQLPAEAEWEYAARGPQSYKYPWGDDDPTSSKATYSPESGGITTEVKSHESGRSWIGAYNMSGNVLEWTSSLYTEVYIQPFWINRGRIDGYEHEDELSEQVTSKGGSYSYADHNIRASNRIRSAPDVVDENNGFRCMRPFPFF